MSLFARPEKEWRVPTISMFYGILVSMYALDIEKHHAPHIHVRYNEFRIVLGIPDGERARRELAFSPDEARAGLD
jgi:hypothetical protein